LAVGNASSSDAASTAGSPFVEFAQHLDHFPHIRAERERSTTPARAVFENDAGMVGHSQALIHQALRQS
jgi:hypothetical protein